MQGPSAASSSTRHFARGPGVSSRLVNYDMSAFGSSSTIFNVIKYLSVPFTWLSLPVSLPLRYLHPLCRFLSHVINRLTSFHPRAARPAFRAAAGSALPNTDVAPTNRSVSSIATLRFLAAPSPSSANSLLSIFVNMP